MVINQLTGLEVDLLVMQDYKTRPLQCRDKLLGLKLVARSPPSSKTNLVAFNSRVILNTLEIALVLLFGCKAKGHTGSVPAKY